MKKAIAVAMLALSVGCSAVTDRIVARVGDDLARTSELAAKYGKPEVRQCADFLNTALGSINNQEDSLQALLAEPTDGILSAALKSVLVKEAIARLNDPAQQAKFKADFDVACKAVAGQIVLDLARDAAKAAKRKL